MEKRRDPYWDNLKLALMFLVVLGHFLMPVKSSEGPFVKALFYWIYLFHMQAFVFVSGYSSKSYVRKSGKENKLTGFLVTFVFFTVCIEIIEFIFTHGIRLRILFRITGAPWYMLAMFFWYLLIPFISRVRPVISLTLSIVLGVLCGMVSGLGSFLTLSRAIVFFSAFLAGYYFDGAWIQKIGKRGRLLSAGILLAVFLVLFFRQSAMSDFLKIIYAKSSYSKLGLTYAAGSAYRLLWYFVSAVMTMSFLSIIPRRKFFFTYIGGRTLSIYIVHRLIRDVFKYLDLYEYLGDGVYLLGLCVCISVAVIFITSADPFYHLVNSVFRLRTNLHHDTSKDRFQAARVN